VELTTVWEFLLLQEQDMYCSGKATTGYSDMRSNYYTALSQKKRY